MSGFGCPTRKKIKSFTEKPERRPDGKIKGLHWILICVLFLFIKQIFVYHLTRVSKVIILTAFFFFLFLCSSHCLISFSVYYDVHWGPFYFVHTYFIYEMISMHRVVPRLSLCLVHKLHQIYLRTHRECVLRSYLPEGLKYFLKEKCSIKEERIRQRSLTQL